MAYDRYDRDERSRWSDDRFEDRTGDRFGRGSRGESRGRDERGFWDRASDEVASWFGDDDADRRRRQDNRRDERMGDNERNWRGKDREWQHDRERGENRDRDRSFFGGGRSDRDFNEDRERFSAQGRGGGWGDKFRTSDRGGFSDRDYERSWRSESSRENRDSERNRSGGGYRPMAGDYGRGTDHESEQFFAASGVGAGERGMGGYDRSQTPYGRDEYRRTSFAGSRRNERDFDPHYQSWRDRHMGDLDRDYDDYRREHQSKFESDFGSWREKRQQKRGLLGQIREHMDVVGKDDEHVGTVDKVAGDRIILTKSDPESGGAHHSLSCSDIDRVEGEKVILDCDASEAKNRWRDESRGRALFEREDQGEMGPRGLNRSFEGTYR